MGGGCAEVLTEESWLVGSHSERVRIKTGNQIVQKDLIMLR